MADFDLSQYRFDALIFDCDGTLAITAPLHFKALQASFALQKLELDESWYQTKLGISRDPLFREYEEEFATKIDQPNAIAQYEVAFVKLVRDVQESPLAASIARRHHGKVPMAVASGGQRFSVEHTLRACGLFELFDTVVTFEDVGIGKPAPDLFLEAARRLNTAPELCLVFEDSEEGVEAAHRAGMSVIDVRKHEVTHA